MHPANGVLIVMLKQFIVEQKNMLIGFAVVLVVFVGFVWLSQPGTSGGGKTNKSSQIVLAAEETNYDFGTVSMATGNVSRRFLVKNPTDRPVTLTKLYTSCMCTKAALLIGDRRVGPFGMPGHGIVPSISETLNPGQSTDVEVTFDPTAHGPAGVGRIDRMVSLENDAGLPLEFRFSANVTP
ncbi:MAG: hypothetical protein UX68_C0011G0026 [Parcubacteria group bacterium GW2011_GWA2_46_9]|nr:MAG: hypothetical protein UX68_C0011G0026 [Parcubacteria group bacterium GW2011_GWA2_46_9]